MKPNQIMSGIHAVYLLSLLEDILAGDLSLLTEFQQELQHAPPQVRLKLQERVERLLVGKTL